MIATKVWNRTVMCPLLLSCATHSVNVHAQHTIHLYMYVPISTLMPMYDIMHAHTTDMCTLVPGVLYMSVAATSVL